MMRLGLLLAVAAVLQGSRAVGAARLNADTVLFGTVAPTASAAPGSCLTLNAVAHELLRPEDTVRYPSSPPKSASYTASARVCPDASAPAAAPFALLFAGVPVPTGPSQILSMNLTATQPAAGPSPAELRWQGAVGVAPGGAAHLALDMAAAERRPLPHTTPKRANKPSSALKPAPSPSNGSQAAPAAGVCSPAAPAAVGALPAAAAALVALAAGAVVGRAMRSRRGPSPVTCDVACSPFPAAAARFGGRPTKALKWARDHEGRLQREGGAGSDEDLALDAAEE